MIFLLIHYYILCDECDCGSVDSFHEQFKCAVLVLSWVANMALALRQSAGSRLISRILSSLGVF